jgi:hypothetical protein
MRNHTDPRDTVRKITLEQLNKQRNINNKVKQLNGWIRGLNLKIFVYKIVEIITENHIKMFVRSADDIRDMKPELEFMEQCKRFKAECEKELQKYCINIKSITGKKAIFSTKKVCLDRVIDMLHGYYRTMEETVDIANAKDQVYIEGMNKIVAESNMLLRAQDDEIKRMSAQLAEKDQKIHDLKVQSAEKDQKIQYLKTQLSEMIARLSQAKHATQYLQAKRCERMLLHHSPNVSPQSSPSGKEVKGDVIPKVTSCGISPLLPHSPSGSMGSPIAKKLSPNNTSIRVSGGNHIPHLHI